MSYSLKIVDGDLSQRGTQLDLVFGKNKLLQDIDFWLRERYGADRFHTNMGSTLQEYIGGILDNSTRREVRDEVFRVLQNYQAVQMRGVTENPQKFSATEVLYSIEDIRTEVLYDRIYVAIKIRNGSGEVSTVVANVST